MTARVFIDGEAGTTGLQIRKRLGDRKDISLLHIPDADRKDTSRRAEFLNMADLVILCLPDDTARKSIDLIDNKNTRVIDASTAHRVASGWVYGFPEYDPKQRDAIARANRVSNPGCYAIASISILHPLVSAGLITADWPITINAVSGYSGGGKDLIAAFEDPNSDKYTSAPFYPYGLNLAHKHLAEITLWGGLKHIPTFVPSVGRYAQGMIVQIPLPLWSIPKKPRPADIHAILSEHYAGQKFVTIAPMEESCLMQNLEPEILNGTNDLHLYVFANEKNGLAVVMGLLDNLGKGASGQAVQNMNIMLDLPEDTGL
ncbi:MAG: N-acetyl-gamma-glutamyl-phosphate reductase [Magnetovibrio sp.]|nr:N-acetyl-gamma-glutamyl-phosphate reductase [Magnetovibrio sp.]|tara:strand:+ start:672 stop:1619 length:948 start_codon:yes stop_codon:yes gene_type:complete